MGFLLRMLSGMALTGTMLMACSDHRFDRRDLPVSPSDLVSDTTSLPVDTVPIVVVDPKPILVDSLAAQDVNLLPGASMVPQIVVLPANADNRNFGLASLNAGVAQVRAGELFGTAVGITFVDAYSLDGSDRHARFQVSVAPKPLKLKSKPMSMAVGDAAVLPQLEFTPPEAAFNGYALSGGDPAIASISADRKTILPVGAGKTSIKAEVVGYPGVSSTMRITIVPARSILSLFD